MQVRLTGYSKLPIGVNVSVNGCLHMSKVYTQWLLGLSPLPPCNPAQDEKLQIMDGNDILHCLTYKPQTIQVGSHTSSTLVLITGDPQGCVLSPHLFTRYTHDCTPRHQQTAKENSSWEEITNLADWCTVDSQLLNVNRPRSWLMILKKRPVYISGAQVAQVGRLSFLGFSITENLLSSVTNAFWL